MATQPLTVRYWAALVSRDAIAEREGSSVILAQIGQPVPGKHALAADDQALAKRLDGVEEGLGPGRQIAFEDGLALVVKDVGEHASCVQVDAAII